MSGPSPSRSLIARFGSAAAALEELPRLARARRRQEFRACRPKTMPRANWTIWQELGGRLIAVLRAGFSAGPGGARSAAAADFGVWACALLQRDMVAIVGARNASALARKFAQLLARDLGEAGLVGRIGPGARHRLRGA